jgi:hypothetical protein
MLVMQWFGLIFLAMASQKVRLTALRSYFKISAYLMYAFTPEKPLRLVGRNFCLAMASQKVRLTALRSYFKISTYLMDAFDPEKPPSFCRRKFFA